MGEAWRRCRVARGQSPTSSMGTEGVGRTPPAEGCRSYRVCLAHRGTRASFLPAGPLEFGVWQLCLLSKRSQRKSFRRGRIEGRLAEGGGVSTWHSLCSKQHVFPGVEVAGVRVLSVQVLRNSFGWELRFTDVPKIPS